MAFSEGGLNCEDTFRRILYYTERRKERRSIPTGSLSSSSSSSSLSQPWYTLNNPEAHVSFRQREWPPPTEHARDSFDDDFGSRPWVMPLASSMQPSTINPSLLAVRNARSLGDLSQNITLLPPLQVAGISEAERSRQEEADVADEEYDNFKSERDDADQPQTSRSTKKINNIDHVPTDFFTTEPNTNLEQHQDENILFFGENGLPTKSKLIASSSSSFSSSSSLTPMIQFERAPRRPHLYALMDLSHEAHRSRLHAVWSYIKAAFRSRPPQGVQVETELLPMLLNECYVPLSKDQLVSLMRQLPTELRRSNAYMTYYDFLEYFGELQKDGTVIEPEPVPINKSKSSQQQHHVTTDTHNTPFDGELATHQGNTREEHHVIHEGKLDHLPKHHVVTQDEDEVLGLGSRHSTRIAMEWDAYKAENELGKDFNDNGNDNDIEELDARHEIDLSLEEVKQFSVITIQSNVRGYMGRKSAKLRRALALCLRHELATLRTVVREWHAHTAQKWMLRDYCKRPLHQWSRYVGRLQRHRYYFQHCFWIFYTWRKDTASIVYSRHKVQNLLHIFDTCRLLHHFRLWKKWHQCNIERKKLMQGHLLHMSQWRQRRALLQVWHPWASARAKLLKKWRERGSHLAAQNQLARRLTWFALWRYKTYLANVVKERAHLYWLFQEKPKKAWHVRSNNGIVDPCLHSTFPDDPLWLRELEPLLTMDQVCLTSVITRKKKTQKSKRTPIKGATEKDNAGEEDHDDDDDDDDDEEVRRIIPVSVMNHIRNKATPILRAVKRQDRNERAISYAKVKRLGPLLFLQFRGYVIWKRKKRYCLAKGLQSLLRHHLHRLQHICHFMRKRRLRKGLPIPALQQKQLEEEKNNKNNRFDADEVEDEDEVESEEGEGVEGEDAAKRQSRKRRARERKQKQKDKEKEEQRNKLDSGGSLGVVHTLEARNRRRQRKIEEAKQEFEEDTQRRKTGLRHNEQLQKEMKDMSLIITTMSTDTKLDHDISVEALSVAHHLQKKIRLEEMKRTQEKRKYILEHMESVKRKRGRLLHDIMCKTIDEQHIKYTRQLAIQCLRRLRIHAVSANSEQIFVRARMKNWIKICTRLKRLDRGMHHYYTYRVKYSVLNKWLWMLRQRYQYGTRGLSTKIERRKELMFKFSRVCLNDNSYYLKQGNSTNTMTREAQLLAMNSDLRATYYRWVEYTQEQKTRSTVEALLCERRRRRTLAKVFYNLMLSVKSTYTLGMRRKNEKFQQLRVDADLDLWRRRMLVRMKSNTVLLLIFLFFCCYFY